MTFEKGLAMDPFNPDLKLGLEAANQGVLQDLLEGTLSMHGRPFPSCCTHILTVPHQLKRNSFDTQASSPSSPNPVCLCAGRGHERRAIEYPATSQRITYHPYSAPLHRVRTEDMLPLRLLTPFQAENDYHIKDTYNYMTVQADIRMPVRHFTQLEDAYHTGQYRAAIQAAVESIEAQDTDCRVLNLGAGAGLHAALALGAGARHVTAVERWLYLALACKETLQENKVGRVSSSVKTIRCLRMLDYVLNAPHL